jgi:bifunctional non-homologous end joining protein LigD
MLPPHPLPPGFIPPCLPTPSERCKTGPDWIHEIKHDGYRLIARRMGDVVRLYTRRGFNWADRYPRIVEALRSLRVRSVVIDGEAVLCGKDGRSDFDRLHSGGYDASVVLYGFDLIELNGEDLRPTSLEHRKGKLEKLLARSDGIRFSEHIEGDGATIFAHACRLGLEGIVSKRRDLPYRSGRSKCWIKLKNPASAAVLRMHDGTW